MPHWRPLSNANISQPRQGSNESLVAQNSRLDSRPKSLYPNHMRVVIQRVSESSVFIDGKVHARIGRGLLVLVGIETGDTEADLPWICGKIARLRVFPDAEGVMNLNVAEVSGELMVVSQFTLHASTHKGNRPSYTRAAHPDLALPLYQRFVEALGRESARPVQSGVFGADMKIHLVNDGPVTLIMDSRLRE